MVSDTFINASSSSIAGIVGRFVCHPIDTCKSKLQASDKLKGIREVIQTTYRAEGIKGFYPGLGITLLGSVPGVCIYISTYEYCKSTFLQSYPTLQQYPALVYLGSGLLAETTCCTLFIPVDVVKQRLQVQSLGQSYHYNGGLDAIRTILRVEGVRGLYKGYGATLFSYGPFSAIYFALFERMKLLFSSKDHISTALKSELAFHENLISAAVAGGTASLMTNPFEVAKLRFQIQQSPLSNNATIPGVATESVASKGTVVYRGLFHALYHIQTHLGWKGLFRGAWTRILFHTPSTAITMTMFEECKLALLKLSHYVE